MSTVAGIFSDLGGSVCDSDFYRCPGSRGSDELAGVRTVPDTGRCRI